jgi:predicted nucleic acid-binding protein
MTKTKKKPTIYIETSVVSYYTSPVSRDIVIAGHQASTTDFWEQLNIKLIPVVSSLVLLEAAKGNNEKAELRKEAVKEFNIVDISDAAENLANLLVKKKGIPGKYPEDALHIAIAAVNGIDLIATWNFKHINNPYTKDKIKQILEEAGYKCPILASPEELLGEE